jgi:hydroxymethylpyrimidine pyrophosphatase-like HAD family hydrolase
VAKPFDSYPHPIKLVLADLDGTVTADELLRPLDCDDLRVLRRSNERSREEPAVPPISLTTGRPHSYLEAFTRFLATPLPSLFESGCGLHLPAEPLGREYLFHPALADPAVAEAVARFRDWAEEELVARRGAGLILGKRYSVSLAAGDGCPVEELQEAVAAMPPDLAGRFFVTRSLGVVDVTPRPVDKGAGLTWLLDYCREELGLEVDAVNVLGIGDSFNDLPFLKRVGLSCAVANAAAEIREAVAYVTREPTGRGVAEVVALATAVNERLGLVERHG